MSRKILAYGATLTSPLSAGLLGFVFPSLAAILVLSIMGFAAANLDNAGGAAVLAFFIARVFGLDDRTAGILAF